MPYSLLYWVLPIMWEGSCFALVRSLSLTSSSRLQVQSVDGGSLQCYFAQSIVNLGLTAHDAYQSPVSAVYMHGIGF
ncbi:hypothetical protein F5Y14DRAFT_399385, partial [Nemania sp. NC0429]